KKKATPKKKAAVKKKAAPKKKAAVKKKAAPKKKAAVKKKAAPNVSPATEKKPTASEIKEEKIKAEKEKKKQKRIELLNKRSPIELPVEGITPYTMHRGESYMSDSQLEHFRNILLRWKQDLIDEVKRTVDQMKNDASQFADPADRATQEEEFSLELRTRDRESKLIRKINQTLSSIDSEDYGYCESCGIEIGIKRLEARPTATLCIDCKTLQEIKEKQIFT
ncbi:MAG: RNA polymerase-binding protein DksA, partial [Gammaproteobacteria bacterium]